MVSTEIVRELLRYEPETGRLFWLPRDIKWFDGNKYAADRCWKSWNARDAGTEAFTSTNSNGYRSGAILRRTHLAHRVIWALVHGEWPEEIDHINGIRDDNRLVNLRSVTRSENTKNLSRQTRNGTGIIGVTVQKNRFRVSVGGGGYVGLFRTIGEAIEARKVVERRLGYHCNHGRFQK